MAYTPLINARATVTAKDINNNSVAKVFSSVQAINFDFAKGMVNIVDATGSFYFPIKLMTTVTDTIVTGVDGQHSFVMS